MLPGVLETDINKQSALATETVTADSTSSLPNTFGILFLNYTHCSHYILINCAQETQQSAGKQKQPTIF